MAISFTQPEVAFTEWAKASQVPVRDENNVMYVYDPLSDKFVIVDSFGLESIYIGEIGEVNIKMRSRLRSCEQRLTANSIGNVSVVLTDPDLALYKAGVFELERTLNYNGYFYRITGVTVVYKHDETSVKIEALSYNAYKLKEDRGAANFGSISPTDFAAMKAAEAGMSFFGEVTAVDGPIVRTQEGSIDESTWDVLSRLARDNELSLFEAHNKLFFASDAAIVSKQDPQQVSLVIDSGSGFQVLKANFKKSTKDEFAHRADLTFLKTAGSAALTPGMAVQILGMPDMEDVVFMVENVQMSADPVGLVMVSCRSDANRDMCTLQEFKLGDTGECVRRIQQAVRVFSSSVVERPATPPGVFVLPPRDPNSYPVVEVSYHPRDPNSYPVEDRAPLEVSYHPVLNGAVSYTPTAAGTTPSLSSPWVVREAALAAAAKEAANSVTVRSANLKIDGVFGFSTETAVKKFQAKVGITQTGVVGPVTWAAIERAT